MTIFVDFTNTGLVYIRGWAGVVQGVEWFVAKSKSKKQDDTIVEFRVTMISTFTHKRPLFYYRPKWTCADSGSDIRSPLPNWSPQLTPFHPSWIYMVSKKHFGEAD